jgi:hypothetical protein
MSGFDESINGPLLPIDNRFPGIGVMRWAGDGIRCYGIARPAGEVHPYMSCAHFGLEPVAVRRDDP